MVADLEVCNGVNRKHRTVSTEDACKDRVTREMEEGVRTEGLVEECAEGTDGKEIVLGYIVIDVGAARGVEAVGEGEGNRAALVKEGNRRRD